MKRVSGQRARLGAKQNRIDHTIKNLDNVVENTQAGISMMSQANQANAGVMSMLQ